MFPLFYGFVEEGSDREGLIIIAGKKAAVLKRERNGYGRYFGVSLVPDI